MNHVLHALSALELMDRQPLQAGQLVWLDDGRQFRFIIIGVLKEQDTQKWKAAIRYADYPHDKWWDWVGMKYLTPIPLQKQQVKFKTKIVTNNMES